MAQSVNLVLKSTQISSSNTLSDYFNKTIDNIYGTIANNRTSITWKNIDMRTLLGDMYDKYDRFNINLNFIAGSGVGTSTSVSTDDRMLQVKLSGLPFTSSYNQPTQTNTGTACLTVVQLPIAGIDTTNTWYSNALSQQYFTFQKQNIVNVSIDLHTISGDKTPTVTSNTQMIGHVLLSFNISGVDNFEKKDITTQRFDLHP